MSTTATADARPARNRRLLSYEDLQDRGIKFSKIHLWRLAKTGAFPKSVKLGHVRIAWFEDEIEQWLDRLDAARDVEEVSHA